MSEDNMTTLKRFYSDVMEAGNVDLVDELAHPDFVEHETFPGIEPNLEGVKQWMAMMIGAISDRSFQIEDTAVDGDKIWVRARMKGTQTGELLGIPATNKSFDVEIIDIVRFKDGRAIEHWGVTDNMAMMQQLGVMEGPPA